MKGKVKGMRNEKGKERLEEVVGEIKSKNVAMESIRESKGMSDM